jgi:hypothetical protein
LQVLANFPAEHDDILLALTGKNREYFAERLAKCQRYAFVPFARHWSAAPKAS